MPFSKVLRVLHKTGTPHSVLLESKELDETLLLESGSVVSLSRAEADEIKGDYTKAIDAYGCLGAIKFSDDTTGTRHSFYLVLVTACMPVGKVLDCEIFRITGVSFYSLQNGSTDSDGRCSDTKKLLSSGKFYFSWSSSVKKNEVLDLTVSMQNQGQSNRSERFFWNRLLHLHFKHFGINCDTWLFRVMSGGIDIKTVYVGAQQAKAMVISRLSCERAGTRFNVRGVNDEGNVANFVESEQVIVIGNNISSFMQVRGSIPLFWEQPGLNVGSHKVHMARGYEASAPTYERHFTSLVEYYGQCMVINLLGSKEGETMLSRLFQNHHEASQFKDSIPFFCFDYHSECRGGKWENLSRLKAKVWNKIQEFGCYTKLDDQNLRLTQSGVARVNCLDCLDRTNSAKTYFGLQMIPKQLEDLGLRDNKQLEDRFREAFKTAWPVTGDLISRMYAGTGALEGKTKLKDGARSVTRAIQNNFLDQNKQNAIDLLILGTNSLDIELAARTSNLLSGDCLQAPVAVLKGMCDNYKAYSVDMPVRVAIGTWNVNGGKHFRSIAYKDQTLDDWLLNFESRQKESCEKYLALFDFPGGEDGDLSFVSGDTILVHEILPDGEWMSGECNGMSGIFPASYVAKIYPLYTAMFDFPSQQDGDLEFAAGDVIEVTEMSGDWWKGKVKRDEYNPDEPVGIFPASFVEKYKDSAENGLEFTHESTDVDWNKPMDIYAIGFQEMVELSAGNIVNTSTTNQLVWAAELEKTLSVKYKYILLACEQLVGVCFYIFIRPQHAPHIRDLEITSVKTGMGGATGNKGGIGIRMQFYNSSLCFVCSHLAAGQGQVNDRNSDFAEICKKMLFNGNKNIFCHDYVFWCGDLNYRIDMPIDDVKNLVRDQNWTALREHDQLNVERKEKRVFGLFNEGETNFAPTYKYDLFSDEYDTSEKSRTPAWTDRVLWFRRRWFTDKQGDSDLVSVAEEPEFSFGRLLYYNRAEIKTSDHRPVIAVLDIDVLQCNEDSLDVTFDDVVAAQGPPDASILVSLLETGGSLIPEEHCKQILAELETFGEVVLTRKLKSSLLVIFKEGTSAIKALSINGTCVNGMTISVSLKFGGWKEEVEHELRHRAHSTSFNESSADRSTSRTVHYDYPPDAFDDESQNYAAEEDTQVEYEYEPSSTMQEEPAETIEDLEDVSDPGWACETNDYVSGASYSVSTAWQNSAPVEEVKPKKAPAPPRPMTRPAKKAAPPRPNTLPAMSSGPPLKPSNTPTITPGPPQFAPPAHPRQSATSHGGASTILVPEPSNTPTIAPGPPQFAPTAHPRQSATSHGGASTILVPEPAPLQTKPPKITRRTTVPKRRAPAPPPGKPAIQVKPKPKSLKPKGAAPALPRKPPKGPNKPQKAANAAFMHEIQSAPNLLDFDPYGSSSTADMASGAATLIPSKVPSISKPNNASNSWSSSNSAGVFLKQSQSASDLLSSYALSNSTSRDNGIAWMSSTLPPKSSLVQSTSITPPPLIPQPAPGLPRKSSDAWLSSSSIPRRRTSATPPPLFSKPAANTLPPRNQPSNPIPDDWLNFNLTQLSSAPVQSTPNSFSTSVRPQNANYKPMIPNRTQTLSGMSGFMGSQPLQPTLATPLKPNVLSNGSSNQFDDPFGIGSFNQSTVNNNQTAKSSTHQNDPWGSASNNVGFSNSFSTDFSKMNLK